MASHRPGRARLGKGVGGGGGVGGRGVVEDAALSGRKGARRVHEGYTDHYVLPASPLLSQHHSLASTLPTHYSSVVDTA